MTELRDERRKWIEMYEQTGYAGLVCSRFGISRPTLRKWLRRYQELGLAGLEEPSRKPVSSPNRKVFAREEALILELRRRDRLGVQKLKAELLRSHGVDLSVDTILKVLRRAGEPRKRGTKVPSPTPPPIKENSGWLGRETLPVIPPAPGGAPHGSVAAVIADLIAQGEFRPAQKLSEGMLSARLGRSRTLVREALKELSYSGLVTLERNRGALVANPSLAEVEQAYAARRLIESEIIGDVTRNCTVHDVRLLKRHLALQVEAHAASDRGRLVRLLTEFHLLIASLGESRILESFVANLTAKTSLAVLLYDQSTVSCSLDDHTQLIALMAAGDEEGARHLMQQHLTTNQQRLPRPDLEKAGADKRSVRRHEPAPSAD
jgi:DNA-binding GntR family transcriptional regulator/transposase